MYRQESFAKTPQKLCCYVGVGKICAYIHEEPNSSLIFQDNYLEGQIRVNLSLVF